MRATQWEMIRVIGLSLTFPGGGQLRQGRYRFGVVLALLQAGDLLYIFSESPLPGLLVLMTVAVMPILSTAEAVLWQRRVSQKEPLNADGMEKEQNP